MPNDLMNVADEFERHVMLLFKATAGDGFTEDDFQAQVGEFAQFAMDNRGPILSALRSPGLDRDGERMRGAAERVCHEDQMTVWSGEIVGRLSLGNFLSDDLSYDDVLGLHSAVSDEISRIVESAFTHPELSALPLAHEEKAGC